VSGIEDEAGTIEKHSDMMGVMMKLFDIRTDETNDIQWMN